MLLVVCCSRVLTVDDFTQYFFIANFDGMCKILRVVREDEWILLVWDGTDTPPVAINAR